MEVRSTKKETEEQEQCPSISGVSLSNQAAEQTQSVSSSDHEKEDDQNRQEEPADNNRRHTPVQDEVAAASQLNSQTAQPPPLHAVSSSAGIIDQIQDALSLSEQEESGSSSNLSTVEGETVVDIVMATTTNISVAQISASVSFVLQETEQQLETEKGKQQIPICLSQGSKAHSLPDLRTETNADSQQEIAASDFIIPSVQTADNTLDEMINEDDIEEEELKAAQFAEGNQETSAPSSVAGDQTTVTEAAGTNTTLVDSISTASKPIYHIEIGDEDDLQHHSIMPQQPEILIATAVGFDSLPTPHGVEEEKTEVDEYPTEQEPRFIVEDMLSPPQPPLVEEPPPVPMDYDTHSIPPVIENKRAEYVSVTVLKLQASFEHGLEFVTVDRELRVSHISPTGLFANSSLAAFDRMLRINDLNIETLNPVNASHLLDVLTGSVTVIAQNPGGVADLVESQIAKPLTESRTGIDLRDVCTDERLRKSQMEISRIGQKSLFSASLLHVSDVVVAINGCSDLDQNMGEILLATSPNHCVILARTKLKTQMAIARRPTHQLPPGFNFVRAMEEARRQREELRRKQGCYYNSCERPDACANIFQWLGNVYVITIVITGISISWQTIKEQTIDGSDAVGTILKCAGLFVGGLLLGFLINAPWWFRRVGARFSLAQLVCNVLVLASYFLFFYFFDTADIFAQKHRLAIFFGLFFPLLIIVNLPSVFVKREDGSDGNTICEAPSDCMSSDSGGTDML